MTNTTHPAGLPALETEYTPGEAAELIGGVSGRTVLTWCHNGTIAARRVGIRWRIPASAIAALRTYQPGE